MKWCSIWKRSHKKQIIFFDKRPQARRAPLPAPRLRQAGSNHLNPPFGKGDLIARHYLQKILSLFFSNENSLIGIGEISIEDFAQDLVDHLLDCFRRGSCHRDLFVDTHISCKRFFSLSISIAFSSGKGSEMINPSQGVWMRYNGLLSLKWSPQVAIEAISWSK